MMDLSEIPHEQWEYSILQFTSGSDCSCSDDIFEFAKGETQDYRPISEYAQMETIFNPQLQSRTNDDFISYSNGAFNTRNVEQPLAIAYYPDLSESVQGFEARNIPSESRSSNARNEIPQMEEIFADNWLALTSSDPDYNTGGFSIIPQFTVPYPESLDMWLKQFTTDGKETSSEDTHSKTATSAYGSGPSENNNQFNPPEWEPFLLAGNEINGFSMNTSMWAPQFALADGSDLNDIQFSCPSTGEERKSAVGACEEREDVLGMRKRGEEVERTSKKNKRTEEDENERMIREPRESERKRSSRVSKPPARYSEESFIKPKRGRRLASKCPKNNRTLKENCKIYLVPKVAKCLNTKFSS